MLKPIKSTTFDMKTKIPRSYSVVVASNNRVPFIPKAENKTTDSVNIKKNSDIQIAKIEPSPAQPIRPENVAVNLELEPDTLASNTEILKVNELLFEMNGLF